MEKDKKSTLEEKISEAVCIEMVFGAAGVAAGFCLGAGIEKMAGYFPVSEHFLNQISALPEYSAFAGAAIGLVVGALALIKSSFFKSYSGELVEGAKPEIEQKAVEFPKNELGDIFNFLSNGVQNKEAMKRLYELAEAGLKKSPLEKVRNKIYSFKRGFVARITGIFQPFYYSESGRQKKEISPNQAINGLLNSIDDLYNTARNGIIKGMSCAISGKDVPKSWQAEFKESIYQSVRYACDLALWVAYLSENEGRIGNKSSKILKKYGIYYPESLPEDIHKIGENVLILYTKIAG